MDREQVNNEMIELGVVSIDTKGASVTINDSENGLRPFGVGLTDD